MRKIIIILLGVLSLSAVVSAQNYVDALRYSRLFYGGTARFISMGGAFTALGGDISSLSQNPAGLGVFRSSELTISPQLMHIKTDASFNGITSDYSYNFNLSQAGIVSNLISNSNESGLITLNFGYSFNKTNNLNQTIRINGINNSSSMADYWSAASYGWYKDELGTNVPDALLANKTLIIDTLSGSNTGYGTVFSNYGDNPPSIYGQNVRRFVSNDGYTSEHAFSIGGNYSNKIFFGATIGISRLKYTGHYEHLESTDQAMPSLFKNFTYTNHFENTGTGYSLKVGAIIKPIETLRIGLALHSPTYYRINEYAYDNMTSNFTDGYRLDVSNDPLRFSYALTTPFRALAGVAVQVKKIALLSAEYEFVDYSTARFYETGDGYDYSDKNQSIKNTLQPSSNIRIGGEVRLNKLYLRSGYGLYGKAFKPDQDNADLNYSSLSFGLGFRERNVAIDFAYSNIMNNEKYYMYPLDSSFDPALVNLATTKNMFTVTLGYKFGY